MVRMTGVGCQLYLLTVFPSACSLQRWRTAEHGLCIKERLEHMSK